MTNTEKPTTKAESKKQNIVDTSNKKQKIDVPKKIQEQNLEKKDETTTKEQETNEEKNEPKKPIQKKPVIKKTEAVVNAKSLPISTKYSVAICKFIKNKKIEKAIADLEQVLICKKVVPMKGEIPHKKGKKIMSGRYPKKATEHFIKLLKNLLANSNANELEGVFIAEAISNIAQRPYGRFGRIRKKRTHVKIIAKEKKNSKDKKRKKEKN